jgi:hypothetical protein
MFPDAPGDLYLGQPDQDFHGEHSLYVDQVQLNQVHHGRRTPVAGRSGGVAVSWTYTRNPSTATSGGRRDALRLLLNDLSSSRPLRQDEELAFALSQENNNLYLAAAWMCESLADNEAVQTRVGDLSIGGEKPKNYREAAASYRMLGIRRGVAGIMPAMSSGAKLTYTQDTDRVQPIFTRGMMTKPGQPVGIEGTVSTGLTT